MAIKAIVSYDDTLGDRDALMLGRVFSAAGVGLVLAYVRHVTRPHPRREQLEEHEAETLLARGAAWLDRPVDTRVVVSGSTAEGLEWLARQEEVQMVVFGSDYRTAVGRVSPQHSAQSLLAGGPAAVAIAPAGYSGRGDLRIRTVGLRSWEGDPAACETAFELAARLGAEVVIEEPSIDLLVVGSRPEASPGRVLISARAERAIEDAKCPILVVPSGRPSFSREHELGVAELVP